MDGAPTHETRSKNSTSSLAAGMVPKHVESGHPVEVSNMDGLTDGWCSNTLKTIQMDGTPTPGNGLFLRVGATTRPISLNMDGALTHEKGRLFEILVKNDGWCPDTWKWPVSACRGTNPIYKINGTPTHGNGLLPLVGAPLVVPQHVENDEWSPNTGWYLNTWKWAVSACRGTTGGASTHKNGGFFEISDKNGAPTRIYNTKKPHRSGVLQKFPKKEGFLLGPGFLNRIIPHSIHPSFTLEDIPDTATRTSIASPQVPLPLRPARAAVAVGHGLRRVNRCVHRMLVYLRRPHMLVYAHRTFSVHRSTRISHILILVRTAIATSAFKIPDASVLAYATLTLCFICP
ncbi:hypothetical protein B0H16DRAFT_1479540 [Mycena metata]|uniref:Uncharacterized protein n=1 Tax=Mycena metata TaxID=1033252 RepID=A0AAD7H5A1_9AGAR|nr:hypothetical protein B0H16DRAFT_1479540 [Mycena metata]